MRSQLGCLLLLAGSFFGCTQSFAQDLQNEVWQNFLRSQKRTWSGVIDNEGVIRDQSAVMPGQELVDTRDFFLHPVVIQECDFSEPTVEKIQRVFDGLSKDLTGLETGKSAVALANKEPEKNKQDVREKVNALYRSAFRDVDSLLTEPQRRRLLQIQLRFLCARNGFSSFLNQPKVVELMGLERFDSPKLIALERRLYAQGKENMSKFRDEFFENWFRELPEAEVEKISKSWKSAFQSKFATSWLVAQMNFPADKIDLKSDSLKWPKRMEAYYRHGADGGLEFYFFDEQEQKIEHPNSKFYLLESLIDPKSGLEGLDLTSEQEDKIDDLHIEFHTRSCERAIKICYQLGYLATRSEVIFSPLGKPFEVKVPDWTSKDYSQEIYEQFKILSDREDIRFSEEMCDRFVQALIGPQADLLKEHFKSRRILVLGPLADIEHGRLGQLLDADETDKKSLRERGIKAIDHLASQSRDLHEEILHKLISSLSEENQKRIKSKFGGKLSSGYVDFAALESSLLYGYRANE